MRSGAGIEYRVPGTFGTSEPLLLYGREEAQLIRQQKLWRPEGKTDDKILQSLLCEAGIIIDHFDKVAARQADELAKYRVENPRNTGGKELERWKQETLLTNLFEIAQPDEFNYDFHEQRKAFFDKLEAGEAIDLGSTFVDICSLSGIKPLYATILNARQFQPLIYSGSDPRSSPVFDPAMFDLLEFDVTLLRLYSDAANFYGQEHFLLLLKSRKND